MPDRLARAADDLRRMASVRRTADRAEDAAAAAVLERIADELPGLAGTQIAAEFDGLCAALTPTDSAARTSVSSQVAGNWAAYLLLAGRPELPNGMEKPVHLPADGADYLRMLIGLAAGTMAMAMPPGATRH